MTTDATGTPNGVDLKPDPEWPARCRLRLRAAMVTLAEADEPLTDVTVPAEELVPLTEYDASRTKSGAVRARVNLLWNLTTIVEHSGWLHATSEGGYRLSREGRAILERVTDPQELYELATAGYAKWDELRKAVLPDPVADPATEIVHAGSSADHAFLATKPVLSAWRTGGSAFLPGTSVWNRECAAELSAYLKTAASPVHPTLPGLVSLPSRVLAAEALVLLLAPLSDLVGSAKRSWIRNPLVPPVDPPGLPWELSAHLEQGFVHAGQALIASPTKMLTSFASVLETWFDRTGYERDGAWNDPWTFRDLVDRAPELDRAPEVDPRVTSLLCVVAHPSSFTTVLRPADRVSIVEKLATDLDELTGATEADLKTITLRLQRENGGKPTRYDVAPVLQQWSDAPEGGSRAWLVRGEVDQQNRVPAWVSQGYVSITVGQLTRFPKDVDQVGVATLVDQHYAHLQVVKREVKKRDVLDVALGMQPGDLIASVDGDALRLGRLEDSPAELRSIGGTSLLTRRVAWHPNVSPVVNQLPGSLRTRLRFKGGDVLDLTDVVGPLTELTEVDEGLNDVLDEDGLMVGDSTTEGEERDEDTTLEPAGLTCDTTALATTLHHTDSSWLDELMASLNERRHVVLEGPPGTGKTYLVKHLLEACGLQDAQSSLVQFHPTYSYEDFVEGFRPVASVEGTGAALAVRPGPLKRLADEARNAPGKPYVLVIDEINRANIAKVFGELYFLLEYRDHEIELLYSEGEQFKLPENLFIIGTMNTADRSIALLDAAMRRRFVFMSMDSDEPALTEVLRRWCVATGHPAELADLRDRLNEAMAKHGLDGALAFGPSYFMRPGHGSAQALDRVWRRELRPMLLEHHYGNQTQVDAWYPFALWLQELGLSGATSADIAADPMGSDGDQS